MRIFYIIAALFSLPLWRFIEAKENQNVEKKTGKQGSSEGRKPANMKGVYKHLPNLPKGKWKDYLNKTHIQ